MLPLYKLENHVLETNGKNDIIAQILKIR